MNQRMTNLWILTVLILVVTIVGICKAQANSDNICKKMLLDQFVNGRLISDSLQFSGNFYNELGSYKGCSQVQSGNQKYVLQILTSKDTSTSVQTEYVIGNCLLKNCSPDFIDTIGHILHQNPIYNWRLFNYADISYRYPDDDFAALANNYSIGYYVMLSVLCMTLLLGVLGVIVQYTGLANLQDKNVMQVNFTEKEGKKQYIELLTQNDRLLLNRKKIWGIFFLCFSIPRNTMILFYDTEKQKKVGFMRMTKVLGIIWTMFIMTMYFGLITYPTNFVDYPYLTTSPGSVVMLSGEIFGVGLMFFHTSFQLMYGKLKDIYLKNEGFNSILFFIKMFIYYAIPTAFIVAVAVTILPFAGDGPLYPQLVQQNFLDPCVSYWWTDLLLINTFYPSDMKQQCIPSLVYISNEFLLSAILVPFFLFVYRFAFRPVLVGIGLLVLGAGSIFPIVYVTIVQNIDAFPNFQSGGIQSLYPKIFFRLTPFVMGGTLAILKFEQKYVDKLNDGRRPFHKRIVEKVRKQRFFKHVCYVGGLILMCFPVFILITDTLCVDKSIRIQDLQNFSPPNLNYCWSTFANAAYTCTCQIIFFLGFSLFITPLLIGQSDCIRPLMSSHIWHVLEELSLSAYLLSSIVIAWFFMNRQTNSLISVTYLFTVTVSGAVITFFASIPFYLLVERPFKNFLDLILFPKRSIFRKQKDLDSDSDEGEGEEMMGTVDSEPDLLMLNEGPKGTLQSKKTMMTAKFSQEDYSCEFCSINQQPGCECQCLFTKKKCKCIKQLRSSTASLDLSNPIYGSRKSSMYEKKINGTTNIDSALEQIKNEDYLYSRPSEQRSSNYNPRTQDKKVSFKFQIDSIS